MSLAVPLPHASLIVRSSNWFRNMPKNQNENETEQTGIFLGSGAVPSARDSGDSRGVRGGGRRLGLRVRHEALLRGRSLLHRGGQGRLGGGRRDSAKDAQGARVQAPASTYQTIRNGVCFSFVCYIAQKYVCMR